MKITNIYPIYIYGRTDAAELAVSAGGLQLAAGSVVYTATPLILCYNHAQQLP